MDIKNIITEDELRLLFEVTGEDEYDFDWMIEHNMSLDEARFIT